jgi:cytochrome c oxidase assembly protein subunit 15
VPRSRSFRLEPATYRRVTLAAVVALGVIVVSGAAVRLTGSGLGCTDWPNCSDGSLVAPLEFHPMVEFLNRLFTGVVSVAVAAAVLGAYRRRPVRRDLIRWSWGLVVGVIAQIVWGGVTVMSDLHPAVVSGHFLISMALMWNAVVLAHLARRPDHLIDAPRRSDRSARLATVTAAWGAAALVTGPAVTGTGPHAGDENARRFAWNLTTAARLHSITMWVLVALLVATAVVIARERGGGPTLAAARLAIGAAVAQGALGYLQYALSVPPLLVAFHVAGATIVWSLTVHLALVAREPDPHPVTVREGVPDREEAMP